jgi:uncharacterized protein (TIGR03118 family)
MLFRSLCLTASATIALTFLAGNALTTPLGYSQTNLVSDIPGLAANTDPNLKNPWGISFGATSPFWVSDNATGLATLYNGSGTPQALVVSIPLPGGGGLASPTGQVFNGPGAFSDNLFLFATEEGTIAGWRRALGTTAETLFDNTAVGSVYKGLAISRIGSDRYLYAANFSNNRIDVFPSAGAPALTGSFTDPTLPSGYAPFNIQNVNGQLYVAYAKKGAGIDEEAGPGNGYVSVFDLNGAFVRRFASQGNLNAPWGLVMAPAGWGMFGGDFLIGNFGDGVINAFDSNGMFVGAVANGHGQTLVNDGLWGLTFGNGGNGGSRNSLYLTAGLNDETNGLFARVDPVPEPGTMGLLAAGLFITFLRRNRA